jgi:ClpX C4-type zinc finger
MLIPELLDKARSARTDLEEADRRALLSRAEYHTAIRRLHLAGGSVREVAQALSLSHQRIQQIVQGAGGTWWGRMWRTRRVRPDAVCTWCGRPPSEVAKLIAGPRVYICDACIASAERAASGRETGSFSLTTRASIRRRCSFCGRIAAKNRSILAAPAGQVCSACLATCRQILDSSSGDAADSDVTHKA